MLPSALSTKIQSSIQGATITEHDTEEMEQLSGLGRTTSRAAGPSKQERPQPMYGRVCGLRKSDLVDEEKEKQYTGLPLVALSVVFFAFFVILNVTGGTNLCNDNCGNIIKMSFVIIIALIVTIKQAWSFRNRATNERHSMADTSVPIAYNRNDSEYSVNWREERLTIPLSILIIALGIGLLIGTNKLISHLNRKALRKTSIGIIVVGITILIGVAFMEKIRGTNETNTKTRKFLSCAVSFTMLSIGGTVGFWCFLIIILELGGDSYELAEHLENRWNVAALWIVPIVSFAAFIMRGIEQFRRSPCKIPFVYSMDLSFLLVSTGLGLALLHGTTDSLHIVLAIYSGVCIFVLLTVWSFNLTEHNTVNGGTNMRESTRCKTFPCDSYSFLVLYPPNENLDLFAFGLMAFVFQATFFTLMILSVVAPKMRTAGEVDNPDSEGYGFGAFIPSNVTFISALDECAFGLAKGGKYGSMLEVAAKRIEVEPLPRFMCHKHRHVRYRAVVSLLSTVLLGLMCFVAFSQESSEVWVTKAVKVTFDASTDLDSYSGCYEMVSDSVYSKRYSYGLNLSTPSGEARLGYCKDERRWNLFQKAEGVVDVDGTNSNDPCSSDLDKFAYSTKTDSFDIFGAFDTPWYTISNTQLSLSILNLGNSAGRCVELGNGKCDVNKDIPDLNLNKADFNYDDGDCCAETCIDGTYLCGVIDTAFGVSISSGYGFLDCNNPGVTDVPVVLTFQEIEMAESIEMVDSNFTLSCNEKKTLSIPISQSMELRNEKFHIRDRAECTIDMTTMNNNASNSWMIKYNIVYEDTDAFVISEGNISTNHTASDSFHVYQKDRVFERVFSSSEWNESDLRDTLSSFTEIILDESNTFAGSISSGIKFFTNLNYLSIIIDDNVLSHLTGSLPNEIGFLTRLTVLNLYNNAKLTGSLPTQIGELTGLTQLQLFKSEVNGPVPTEIGKLTGLTLFRCEENKLSGSLPTEIGMLSGLTGLSLDINGMTGSIPTEIGLLTSLTYLVLSKFLSG
eukprot:jgi/Psemu1/292053/fgenesh1_pg.903_\